MSSAELYVDGRGKKAGEAVSNNIDPEGTSAMEDRLAQVLQLMMEDRKSQEKTMERLLERIGTTGPLEEARAGREETPVYTIHLKKITGENVIKAYLTTLERLMEGYGVDRSKWSYYITCSKSYEEATTCV